MGRPLLREKPGDGKWIAALRARMFDAGVSYNDLGEHAHGTIGTVKGWMASGSQSPTIDNYEAALNALGYELKIVEKADK